MGGHAILSASSSHRWINCTPSARLELNYDSKETEASAEGTAAHALCEYKLMKALNLASEKPASQYDGPQMDGYTDGYAGYVLEALEEAKKMCKDPIILIEHKLDFSCYVPDGFGTGDAVIIADSKLRIIDFKYGQGVLVDAEDNPQMKLYALGALELFENLYDIAEVEMTIYQPRRENISTWSIEVSELKRWVDEQLKPTAEIAYEGGGEYQPGEWCQFCRAAVKCRARAEAKMRLAEYEFKLPPLLADDEIEDILASVDDLTKWANDITAYATEAAINHGKRWTGFKLVEGRSIRKYKDEEAVAEASEAAGYMDIYKQSLITLTEMEKLMGKVKFQDVLGGLVIKPPGKLALVPESDKRQVVNISNAMNEFSKIEEE